MGAFPTPLAAFGLVYAIMFVKGFPEEAIFNVMSYGAVGGSNTDSSQAISKAWKAACNSKTKSSTVLIPKRQTVMVKPILLSGPCRAKSITFMVKKNRDFPLMIKSFLEYYLSSGRCKLSQINGVIVAPTSPKEWAGTDKSLWLAFKGISRLSITGSGIGKIDGRGTGWWNQSCRDHPSLEGRTLIAPTATKIISCNDTNLSNLHFINSSQAHVLLMECRRTEIKNLVITAPESSPNTDGIHIHSSHNIIIKNTTIGTVIVMNR
ncbi:probable polygalacturonase At1g80170 isoform X3 [Cucumis melo]|uniref:Probable polygalacturonase At1g80170 isoform X3 n=1 Tax=Cucumis melo TaxID=3656 RepID=A0ABM3KSN2_CUCME|nr:probable polygalacturonase At1g80170 isoform X3 [Cucumis melo]XP_050940795.1 probable polygalacturonase At1g80170 isoform X3 [Cucumis melo]